jgi:hypothetical protein
MPLAPSPAIPFPVPIIASIIIITVYATATWWCIKIKEKRYLIAGLGAGALIGVYILIASLASL